MEALVLDASKYTQHFPDEREQFETPDAAFALRLLAPRPALLVALSRLEREFRDILRTQEQEHEHEQEHSRRSE